MKTISLDDAAKQAIELMRNPPEPKPCVMCGKPTRFESFNTPVCCPYGEHGEIVNECKWDFADQRRGHKL